MIRRLALLLVPLALFACSSPAPVRTPEQDVDGLGLVVTWTTDEPTLGTVRFGTASGEYDRVAYPPAKDRQDRTFTVEHSVTLLSPRMGETVYLQLVDVTPDGRTARSGELAFVVTDPAAGPFLKWTMIDVGFGDSHLLEMPNTGRRILIDAGERRDAYNVDTFLQEEGVTGLDVMIGTHVHIDHMGGMMGETFDDNDGILEAYPTGRFVDSSGKAAGRSVYDEILALLDDRGIPRDVVDPGDSDANKVGLAWDPQVSVEVLSGGMGGTLGGSNEGDRINNDSIALRVTFGDVDIVMGGDAQVEAEQYMLGRTGVTLESEVLKIHHHGRDDASISPFLDTVNPRAGLIPIVTFESNSGTLPSGAVLTRMRDRFIDIYSGNLAVPLDVSLTGDNGHHVSVLTDGSDYEIRIRPSASRHYPPTAPGGPREDLP